MSNTTRIHTDKTPRRIHFIPEWADKRGLKQIDIVQAIGADKGLVSRWFSGTVPKAEYLDQLAELLHADDVSSLFRHPDDDWLAKMFRDRTDAERERAIEMLRLMFPDAGKTGTDG